MQVMPTPDDLVGELDALDVPFLITSTPKSNAVTLNSVELFKALANAPEARWRAAIIPLLLRHPELAEAAREAAAQLQGPQRKTLKFLYTAALILQRKYAERLARLIDAQSDLPDLFSAELELSLAPGAGIPLQRLAAKHAALTGLPVNWAGTYEHAAERFMKQLENRER